MFFGSGILLTKAALMPCGKTRKFRRKVINSFKKSLLIAAEVPSSVISCRERSEKKGINHSVNRKVYRSRVVSSACAEDILIDCNESDSVISFTDKLRKWAIENRVNHKSVSRLLKILRPEGFDHLPTDARSLLKTPRHVSVIDVPPANIAILD